MQGPLLDFAEYDAPFCYCTLLMRSDYYLPGCLVMAASLRYSAKTKHRIVALVTADVSNEAREALLTLYDEVREVDYVKTECKPMKTQKERAYYDVCVPLSRAHCGLLLSFSAQKRNGSPIRLPSGIVWLWIKIPMAREMDRMESAAFSTLTR